MSKKNRDKRLQKQIQATQDQVKLAFEPIVHKCCDKVGIEVREIGALVRHREDPAKTAAATEKHWYCLGCGHRVDAVGFPIDPTGRRMKIVFTEKKEDGTVEMPHVDKDFPDQQILCRVKNTKKEEPHA